MDRDGIKMVKTFEGKKEKEKGELNSLSRWEVHVVIQRNR
jgi:hypothetical protein